MDANSAERTEVVQSVVPVVLADEIRKDAAKDDRSTSNVIARVLKSYYAKRLARPGKGK